jgi:hypothetical protein
MSTIRVDRITPYQSGSVAIEGLNITDLTIDGTLTASLQQGYVWVGGSGNVSRLVATSSLGGGGSTDISALNTFTQSADGRLDNLELSSGSFATTGSNVFVGTNLFSGSLTSTGSVQFRSPSYRNGIGADQSGSVFTQGTTSIAMVLKPSGSGNTGVVQVYDNEDGNSILSTYAKIMSIGTTQATSIQIGNNDSFNYYRGNNYYYGNITGSNITANSFSGSFTGSVNILSNKSIIYEGGNIVLSSNGLTPNLSGSSNIVIGYEAGLNNRASFNTFIGQGAGRANAVGNQNVYVGINAGYNNISGSNNAFFGPQVSVYGVTGSENSIFGYGAGNYNNGNYNVFMGSKTANSVSTGSENVVVGAYAATGSTASEYLRFLSASVLIGFGASPNNDDPINQVIIGHDAIGNGNNTVTLGNDGITNTYLKGVVSGSSFTGSFVGNGSGLTNLNLPSGLLSSSVINFTDFSQSVDIRIDNIVAGTGFATTGSNTFNGEQIISSSLIVTNEIKGTGSIFLQPDVNDGRKLEIYNTGATDVHIKSNGGLTFLGDDSNYVLIDASTEKISIAGPNGVVVSGSLGVSGSISQKGLGGGGNIVIGDDPITNLNSDAQYNTVIGADAGALLRSGSNNVFIGKMAGLLTQDSTGNVFIGSTAGYSAKAEQNIYIGESAGFSNISGRYNVAIGHQAGYNNKVDLNTFIGWQSGFQNTSGSGNTFVGERTGESNTIGNNNSFFGGSSGRENSVGNNNTFIGQNAGQQNTSGSSNTFVGSQAGSYTTTGGNNTFVGEQAGILNTIGYSNAFFGDNSGYRNTTAYENTFIGSFSGYENKTGVENTFVGTSAGQNNGVGSDNTYIGHRAGNSNISGSNNTLVGKSAGFDNAVGNRNTLLGTEAGYVATSGDDNLMLGYRAGAITNNVQNLTNSNTSIFLGSDARGVNNASNQIVIGALAEGNGSNTVVIGNTSIISTTLRGSVSASLFSGSFIGDGSGLTGITSTLPSDILSSSVTNFTDYSQSVDTRISSIVTGTGFATTGSNTFVGNQVITGSLTLSSSAAVELRVVGNSVLTGSLDVTGSLTISTGSITVPGSGSLVNFVANPSTMRSIRGNGAGLFNIVEQSDGNMTFTVSKIGLGDLTGAITSNISGSTINGSFSDNTTTTSGQGRGARLRGVISGGTVVSLQIETSNSSLGYEEEGQPANRQGIGYKAGDTVTIAQSLNQASGTLTITLRQQDIDTYFGVHNNFSFDYKDYSRLTVGGGIVSSGSISVGAGVETLGSINSIAGGTDVRMDANYSIAVGRDLYNDSSTAYANATFGMHHSSSNYAQTIVGIASRLDDTGEGAFVVGNGTTGFGTDPETRSNLLVAQGSKVQVTGSLDVSGNGYVILSKVSASYNYADDAAAATGGVPLGGLYHTSGTIKIRLA